MEEERRKVYAEVDVTHKTDGTARPRKIKFEDGEVYEIDRVKYCSLHWRFGKKYPKV